MRRASRLDAERFVACHRRLDAMLKGAIPFWQRVVDWKQGGFYGLVDYHGRPRPDAVKDLVQQVRHLWSFSQIHRYEDASESIRDICDHQFEFVRDRLYAPARAEFHRSVAADGSPREGAIHHYLLAFGIYGLSNYAIAFPSTGRGREALRIASDVFEKMVERSYDVTTGFDETAYSGRWCENAKEINTQMHLLEAIAELLEAARAHADPAAEAIEAIARNQLRLVVTRGIVDRGRATFCSRGYERDWTLHNDWEIDFGHDIEGVYLVMAAAKTLGVEKDAEIVDRVVRLGRSVTRLAYDRTHGKWLYSGNPITGKVLQRISSIWVNFEALNGLSTLYQLTGEASYFEKFERVLVWLATKQINPAVGEWYYAVDDEGRALDRDVFGNDCSWMTFAWKSSYHSLRALMTRKRWLEEAYDIPRATLARDR